jgi:uncharacterized membrane protein YfhO
METPGLLVISDLWYEGWNAYLNGELVPIVRTNHAIRGVVVPAGRSTVVLRYEPASLALGIRLMAVALVALALWSGLYLWFARRK